MSKHNGRRMTATPLTLAWLAIAALALFTPRLAHAQGGCEYVQAGPTAGDFFIDCSPRPGGGPPSFRDPDMYLSIAMSPNYTAGAAWAPSKAQSDQRANAVCVKQGGTDCRVVWSLMNGCASVSASKPDKVIAIEGLKGRAWNASGVALVKCRNAGGHSCATLVTACANGYVSPAPWFPPGAGDGSYEPPVFRRR